MSGFQKCGEGLESTHDEQRGESIRVEQRKENLETRRFSWQKRNSVQKHSPSKNRMRQARLLPCAPVLLKHQALLRSLVSAELTGKKIVEIPIVCQPEIDLSLNISPNYQWLPFDQRLY